MEERIIDDEYGRGIRLKKTKDGFVDVTDELAPETEDGESVEEMGDEVAFEFPELEQDEVDEDLIGLTPEQLAEKMRQREEEIAGRKAECEILCAEADALLGIEDYVMATEKYEEATKLVMVEEDEALASRARLGYWKARTENFTNPDEFVSDYIEYGVENFEYDVGYDAMMKIKAEYNDVLKKRMTELCDEEEPLCRSVKEKQEKRRTYLKERVKSRLLAFALALIPMLAALGCALYFGLKLTSTPGNKYVMPTIVSAAVWFVLFLVFIIVSNNLINALRMRKANEHLDSTEEGERLVEIRNLKELYQFVLDFGEEKHSCSCCGGCNH